MEASPYGQLKQSKIRQCFNKANLDIVSEWYVSLIAFPLTGSHGRIPILPDKQNLYSIMIVLPGPFDVPLLIDLQSLSTSHGHRTYQLGSRTVDF